MCITLLNFCVIFRGININSISVTTMAVTFSSSQSVNQGVDCRACGRIINHCLQPDLWAGYQFRPFLAALSSSDAQCALYTIKQRSAMEVASLILALIPLSSAMPLLGLPSGVLMGSYKGIFESDSPAIMRSGRVIASEDQASAVHGKLFYETLNLEWCNSQNGSL